MRATSLQASHELQQIAASVRLPWHHHLRPCRALDIALWDIAGKAANLPLHQLLGGAGQTSLPAYASLLKYKDPERVAARTRLAIQQGYRVHQTARDGGRPRSRCAREVAGDGVPIMVDTNCPWTPEQARLMTLKLRPYDLHWLEEPIFPPEDFQAIAAAACRHGRWPMAAGENNCTALQFRDMFAANVRSTMPNPASPRLAA